MTELQHWEQDKALYLFTSLTAGSSHIVTATSRIETILKNARIPFSFIDTATNESARKLFQRRGKGKKLPFLVKEGFVLADLEQIEEWNEYGELKESIGLVSTSTTSIITAPPDPSFKPAHSPAVAPSSLEMRAATGTGSSPRLQDDSLQPKSVQPTQPAQLALRQAAFESAALAKRGTANPDSATSTKVGTPPSAEKAASSSPACLPLDASSTSASNSKQPMEPTKPITTDTTNAISKENKDASLARNSEPDSKTKHCTDLADEVKAAVSKATTKVAHALDSPKQNVQHDQKPVDQHPPVQKNPEKSN